jgi:hypothetical protein
MREIRNSGLRTSAESKAIARGTDVNRRLAQIVKEREEMGFTIRRGIGIL